MLLFGRPRFPQIGPLSVDPNHALARGLHDCVVFNTQGRHGLVNLADQGLTVIPSKQGTGALPTWGATADGVALTAVMASNASDGGQVIISDQGSIAAGDCAVRVRFVLNGFPFSSTVCTLVSRISGVTREIFFALNSTTSKIQQITLGASNVTGGVGNAIPTGVVHDILATRTGGVGALYQNGVATATGLALAGTSVVAVPTWLANDAGNGGAPLSASYLQYQTWTRNITAAEALQLYLDPFCFLTTTALQINTLPTPIPPPPPVPMMGQIWI